MNIKQSHIDRSLVLSRKKFKVGELPHDDHACTGSELWILCGCQCNNDGGYRIFGLNQLTLSIGFMHCSFVRGISKVYLIISFR